MSDAGSPSPARNDNLRKVFHTGVTARISIRERVTESPGNCMIQRRVKCRGFKALSRVRRRLLQSIRTRDVLLTLPDRVVYIHQRFLIFTDRGGRASEHACDVLFLTRSPDTYRMEFLYRQRRGSLRAHDLQARSPRC